MVHMGTFQNFKCLLNVYLLVCLKFGRSDIQLVYMLWIYLDAASVHHKIHVSGIETNVMWIFLLAVSDIKLLILSLLLLANIDLHFCIQKVSFPDHKNPINKVFRQIVEIPMGNNCAPLVC